jgi:hypothetical protein
MSSLDTMLKWGLPLAVCFAALFCFFPWISKSKVLRWVYAFTASLLIAPVNMPGCPGGFSTEPAWSIIAAFWSWDFVDLCMGLTLAAMFLSLPVLAVTLAIRVMLGWGCRASSTSSSHSQLTP